MCNISHTGNHNIIYIYHKWDMTRICMQMEYKMTCLTSMKMKLNTVLENFPNHALGDCFLPYKAFFSLQHSSGYFM